MEAASPTPHRLNVLLAFLLGMPILAIPGVNRQIEHFCIERVLGGVVGEGAGEVPAAAQFPANQGIAAQGTAKSKVERRAAEYGRIIIALQQFGTVTWRLDEVPARDGMNDQPSGAGGSQFRFVVAVRESAQDRPRQFSAQATDALSAMRAVLREVERWQRLPAGSSPAGSSPAGSSPAESSPAGSSPAIQLPGNSAATGSREAGG